MAPVRFGITTPQHHVPYDELLRLWRTADELGFDSAWLFDHFIPIAGDVEGPCLEAMVTLTDLALQAPRLRVGVLVLGNTYRHPALHAKMAATLDIVTGGRVEWGPPGMIGSTQCTASPSLPQASASAGWARPSR